MGLVKVKKGIGKYSARDAPQKSETAWLCSPDAWNTLVAEGYKPLSACPEVKMCVDTYANLIGSMTIYLMENTDIGDVRVVNELSRKIDIEPNPYMTRQAFISNIVRVMMLEGDGNQFTLPIFDKVGKLDRLVPLPPSQVSMIARADGGYEVRCGERVFRHDELLHFMINPDPNQPWRGTGYRPVLSQVVEGLRQAAKTKKALMESPAPSIIVKIQSDAEELSNVEGQQKLTARYMSNTKSGQPWIIPAELMDVQQVKPLTLNDLAIAKNIELDKRTVAGIFDIPPYLVGVGSFDAQEHNKFISTGVMVKTKGIEQTLTRGLLLSHNWYFKFNMRSLYSYSLDQIISAGSAMVDRMAMDRNEWRDQMGLTPREDMRELLALENYIPATRLGDQKKLEGSEENGG